jgi:hypothetical protein
MRDPDNRAGRDVTRDPTEEMSPACERNDSAIADRVVLTIEPLLVGAPVAARMNGLSERYWRKLDRTGRTPAAVHVGRRRLWSVAALREWSAAGCPPRCRV